MASTNVWRGQVRANWHPEGSFGGYWKTRSLTVHHSVWLIRWWRQRARTGVTQFPFAHMCVRGVTVKPLPWYHSHGNCWQIRKLKTPVEKKCILESVRAQKFVRGEISSVNRAGKNFVPHRFDKFNSYNAKYFERCPIFRATLGKFLIQELRAWLTPLQIWKSAALTLYVETVDSWTSRQSWILPARQWCQISDFVTRFRVFLELSVTNFQPP